MEPDGSNQQNVTHNAAINTMPSWSPDSQRLVFSSNRDGPPNIYVMNRDGSDLINLTRDSGLDAQISSWSPDGQQIVFMATPLETGIAAYLRDTTGLLLGALIAVLAFVAVLVLVVRQRRNLSRAK
jgi:Tol biopolymer transport system component